MATTEFTILPAFYQTRWFRMLCVVASVAALYLLYLLRPQQMQRLPDVTLMDVEMPSLNGIEAINQIRSEFPDARIIVLTTYTGDAKVVRALKAGARAYILKRHAHKELLEPIRAVHAGQKRIPPEIAAELVNHAADDELTGREIDVPRLIATGNGNKQIADQLSIGEATVRTHVGNILSKLGANDRTHAVTIGLSRGIIELPAPPKSG